MGLSESKIQNPEKVAKKGQSNPHCQIIFSQTIPAATGLGTRWQNQRISPVVLLPLPAVNRKF